MTDTFQLFWTNDRNASTKRQKEPSTNSF